MKILQWYSAILFSIIWALIIAQGEVFGVLMLAPIFVYFWADVLEKKIHKAFLIYTFIYLIICMVWSVATSIEDPYVMFALSLFMPMLMHAAMRVFNKSIK